MFLPKRILEEKLRNMLTEDLGQGDITSSLIVPANLIAKAEIIAKNSGIVAGVEEATVLIESLGLKIEAAIEDGSRIKKGQVLMKILGDARTILSVERTLLNVLSRMCGIATATRKIVDELRKKGLKTIVACTRKTAPGLLYFDKKAVLIGGGDTHRVHLIKDNHVAVVGSVEKAVRKAREKASFSKKIEAEVADAEDALVAAKAGTDLIMLDNFSLKKLKGTVELLKKKGFCGRVLLEASGGITEGNVAEFASTGVDIVSLGEITHSSRAFDLSLEIATVKN
jgi:nicotinate-nucleotide pyrophosphorylase (carboxylating)